MNLNDFPKPNHSSDFTQNLMKIINIENKLRDMGYYTNTCRDTVLIIEQNHLDLSEFDFPYASFAVFKKHTLAGEFDFDESNFFSSPEELEQMQKRIKDKKLWVRR